MCCQPGCRELLTFVPSGQCHCYMSGLGWGGRKCHGACPQVFHDSAHWKSVFLQGGVRMWHCSVLRQCPTHCSSALCNIQGLRSRLTETNLGEMFLRKEVSPFPSLLSFHCREGALPSSTMCASLTTAIPVSCLSQWLGAMLISSLNFLQLLSGFPMFSAEVGDLVWIHDA